jgi:DNA polymerase-3 subunit gamma/tau
MLKTLEEPPEHVKFVLATTDPQKVPVTVLSRCLQFNLKPLPAPQIAQRIEAILAAEGVASDAGGVALLARAARGSLRDGLSLLDQAIAYGGGEVREDVVRTMLGAVDRDHLHRIVDALAAGDGAALLREADAVAARGLSAASALDELASLFHRVAVVQALPDATANFDDATRLAGYAKAFTPESVQLAYQICAQGRADLAIAPDDATGFAMTLLRLLAFEPALAESKPARGAGPAVVAAPRPAPPAGMQSLPSTPTEWPAFVGGLKLGGMASQLAAHTELRSVQGHVVNLALPATHKHLADRAYSDKLKAALEAATGSKWMLAFEVGEATPASLASQERRERDQTRERTEAAFREEPFVRDLVERFDGRVRSDSIKPVS